MHFLPLTSRVVFLPFLNHLLPCIFALPLIVDLKLLLKGFVYDLGGGRVAATQFLSVNSLKIIVVIVRAEADNLNKEGTRLA